MEFDRVGGCLNSRSVGLIAFSNEVRRGPTARKIKLKYQITSPSILNSDAAQIP
jgi:hypothetical protein